MPPFQLPPRGAGKSTEVSSTPAVEVPDPYADFVIGAWVELVTNGRVVRTQLTWASPHGTLFLFTAPDASTQSMTRRMRDKLAQEGSLRVVPAPSAKGGRAAADASAASGVPGTERKSADARASGARPPSSSKMVPLSKSAPLSSSSGSKSSKSR